MLKEKLQDLLWRKIKIPMLSKAGKMLGRQISTFGLTKSAEKLRKPYEKNQHLEQQQQKQLRPKKKTATFHTISRQTKNSYCLRFNHEINLKSNYQPNLSAVLPTNPQYKVSLAKFQRRINFDTEKIDKALNKSGSLKSKRCSKSISAIKATPLITKDIMKWKKSHHQLDFNKQRSHDNNYQINSTFCTQAQNIRHILKNVTINIGKSVRSNRAHNFKSYTTRKYLQNQKILPDYDILNCNLDIVKPRWKINKSNLKFNTFRDKIALKSDRSERPWNSTLDYHSDQFPDTHKIFKNIQFGKSVPRLDNQLHSKYPMKLSQINPENLKRKSPWSKRDFRSQSSIGTII